MKNLLTFFLLLLMILFSCKKDADAKLTDIQITPISHGTLVLEYDSTVIYVDPVGGKSAFEGQKPPNVILITDIHGDHLNIETLEAIMTKTSRIVAPLAVAERLTDSLKMNLSILPNGEHTVFEDIEAITDIEAVPMYNLREEAKQFHEKGRGNGYVITIGKKRLYISGDTEDIQEMRQLKNIDIAFVCMNLPWTMPVESAADAVLEFKPKIVYPYHFRGTQGLSNVGKFKEIVNSGNANIDVRLENWYPNR